MYTIPNTLQTALTNKTPQRVLLEFIKKPSGAAYNPVVTYSNEDILVNTGVELDETFQSEEDFGVGGTPSAEIRFEMVNDNGQLRTFEFGTFRAWLGARIDSGTPASGTKTATFTEGGVTRTYQFTPLGMFIAHRPNIVSTKTIDVDANDQMTLFDVEMPKDSASGFNVTWPTTLGGLLTKMCNYLGVTQASTTFTNSTLTVSSRPKDFDSATMRDVLGWIAEAAGSVAKFDRDGKLKMAWFNTVSKTYTESSYSDFTPYRYETKAVNRLSVRKDGNESTTGSGKNAVMILNNPFIGKNTSTAESNIYSRLTAAPTFHPASASLFTDWNIEAGDVVTVQNEGTNYTMPMYNVRLKWSGDTKVDAESTGNEQRDSLPALEKKYYGGAGGLYTAKNGDIWYNEVLDEVNSIRTVVTQTSSQIRAWVEDADSQIAALTIDVNSIRAEVVNARSEYAAFVIEANQIRSRVSGAEDNITTLEQTSNTIRAWAEGAENRIADLELSQSGLIVKVGQKNTTYRQWNDPRSAAGGSHDVSPGDRWIKTRDIGNWGDAAALTWDDLGDANWKDAAGPIEFVWTGASWVLVNDYGSDVLLGAQFSVLDDRIQGIVRDVDGRTSMIEQTANYIKSTVTDTKNGLSSMILQEASQIRAEVNDEVNSLHGAIQVNAGHIGLLVNTTNNTVKGSVIVQIVNNSSEISLSADKIQMTGQTTLAGLLRVTSGDITATGRSITAKDFYTGSGGGIHFSNNDDSYSLSVGNVGNLITELQISSSGNIYTLEKKTVGNNLTWTKVADFNRGTTPVLSGAWNGAIYTVTATGATPVSTSIQLKPNGNGQATSFSAEVYNDDPNVAANKRLSEYVYLTESVSTKYVYARWASSTGTPYARVSTAETYNDGYIKGANATVSISGSWNTSTATYTATALPGTNKKVSTTVFLVPEGNGQSDNFSVHTTHTAGNTSAVKLRTQYVYVTEDVSNKYAHVRWGSSTGTAFARVSTANTYNAGKNSVTLSEAWNLNTGTYTVTASNSSTNKKSTQIFLVPDGNNQSNNFSVYATHTAGTTSAAKVRTNYVYATEDVSGKKVDVRWGSASGTPYAHVDTTSTYKAGQDSVTISGSWAYDDSGVFTYTASNSASRSTTIHLTTKRAGDGNTSIDHFPIWVYNGNSTANCIIKREIYLVEVASTTRNNCKVQARWNSTGSSSTYGSCDTTATWDAGANSVEISAAWSIIGANNACRYVELDNGKSDKTYIHVTGSKDDPSVEAPPIEHFPIWVYYGSNTSNRLVGRDIYLQESVSNKWVNARWNDGTTGSIFGRISTEATYNSVTISGAWNGAKFTVTPTNNKSPISTTIGLTGDGQNDSFTVSAYRDGNTSSTVKSINGYLVVTTSSTRNNNKAEVRLVSKTGTSSILVSSETLGAVYDAGYGVTTSQIGFDQLSIQGGSASIAGRTQAGTLSKTNIQANGYIFFRIGCHGTNKLYYISVNP